MRRRTPLATLLLLGLLSTAASCPPKDAPASTQRAAVAVQVLQRDQELQSAAIAANTAVPKQLSDADAIAIVQFTTTTADEIAKAPAGWPPVIQSAYQNLKRVLANRITPALQLIFSTLDVLLASIP